VGKLAKSSITQQRIGRSCWNLTRWWRPGKYENPLLFKSKMADGSQISLSVLSRCKSAAYCSISVKIWYRVWSCESQCTANVEAQSVRGQGDRVTYRISSRNVVSQQRIGLSTTHLVKVIPVRSAAVRDTCSTSLSELRWKYKYGGFSIWKHPKTSANRRIIAVF